MVMMMMKNTTSNVIKFIHQFNSIQFNPPQNRTKTNLPTIYTTNKWSALKTIHHQASDYRIPNLPQADP